MLKKNLLKISALVITVCCLLCLAACGNDSKNNGTGETETQKTEETSGEVDTEKDTETDKRPEDETEIAKINGGADEVGIYSVVIKLTDKAADKGTVEMVYHGAKGSPQENSVVNTFRIEYYKETDGTFEIKTFFDGDEYQTLRHKDEVKVTNTFGASLRAGDVTVSYTPDGGETREIFKADAEYFRDSFD